MGMAYLNRIDIRKLQSRNESVATCYSDLLSPVSNLDLRDLINYYQLLQMANKNNNPKKKICNLGYGVKFLDGWTLYSDRKGFWQTFVKDVKEANSQKIPLLFSMGYGDDGGHTILTCGYKETNQYHIIQFYDNNQLTNYLYLYIDKSSYKFWFSTSGDSLEQCHFYANNENWRNFEYFGVDNWNNIDENIVLSKETVSTSKKNASSKANNTFTYFTIPAGESFRLENHSGEYLEYSNNEFSSTIDVYGFEIIGDDSQYRFKLAYDDNYNVTNFNDSTKFCFRTDADYISVLAKGVNKINVKNGSSVTIDGSAISYNVRMSLNTKKGFVELLGEVSKSASFIHDRGNIIIEADDLSDVKVNEYNTEGDISSNSFSGNKKIIIDENKTGNTIIASGSYNKYVSWTLTSTGVLTISGTGAIERSPVLTPLREEYRNQIKFVVIEKGITGIGDYVFYKVKNLISVTIPDSVNTIGEEAFSWCTKLTNVKIRTELVNKYAEAFSHSPWFNSIVDKKLAMKIYNRKLKGTVGEFCLLYISSDSIPDLIYRDSPYSYTLYVNGVYIENSYVGGPGTKLYFGYYPYKDFYAIYENERHPRYYTVAQVDGLIGCHDCISIESSGYYEDYISESEGGRYYNHNLEKWIVSRSITKEAFESIKAKRADGETERECVFVKITEENLIRYILEKKPITKATVTGLSAKTYTGKAIIQTLTVKSGSTTLKLDTDYSVSYKNNTNAGTATVTITGKGNYAGTKTATFKINKANQAITAKTTASSIDVGKTATVSITGAKGTKSFKSSNTSIATVNASTGVVTGKKAGAVTITATSAATSNYNAASKTVKITVNKGLKKPGNCHFIKWNNSKYTSCRISWNKVDGADGYQTLLSWTDGSHASSTYTKSNVLYRNCTVHPQHVSQMKVRAYFTQSGQRKFGQWSNLVFITPSPATLTTKNTSLGMNISWNIIYGCNGYNVFLTTNPNGTWYWNQSTSEKADATSATITKYRGSKLKKGTRYYVRIVTRRKRNGVFCTVPMPAENTSIGSFVIK